MSFAEWISNAHDTVLIANKAILSHRTRLTRLISPHFHQCNHWIDAILC